MRSSFKALAVALLIAGSAAAQSTPATSAPAPAGTAGVEQLLEQRAAGASLANPVDAADSATLRAEAASHADYADLRADDLSHSDGEIILITVAVVVLIVLLV